MAKYKAVRPKKTDAAPQMRPGLPCLVMLIAGMILVVIVMILAMKHAS
ncbi:MAG TPA: hypothetical protein VG345_12270 [Bryobacteraceae bacterium]|jgi:hypothetical protein|nr:hypothetical protein [Bryobacteraceae bacterium]